MNYDERHIGDSNEDTLDDDEAAPYRAGQRPDEGDGMRPLSAKYRPSLHTMRPGALDYREVPSRMGEQLVAHGEKAVA